MSKEASNANYLTIKLYSSYLNTNHSVPILDVQLDDSASAEDCYSELDDPYDVESIVKQRYNSQKSQYKCFVKWLGYSRTHAN